MCRLSLRLPTVLQVSRSYVILFHEGSVSELAHLDDLACYRALYSSPDNRSSRIWALVDSDPGRLEPAGIIKCHTPLFVVDTMPTFFDRPKWLFRIGHKCHRMKPWSALEILRAYVYLALGVRDIHIFRSRPFLSDLDEDQLQILRIPQHIPGRRIQQLKAIMVGPG